MSFSVKHLLKSVMLHLQRQKPLLKQHKQKPVNSPQNKMQKLLHRWMRFVHLMSKSTHSELEKRSAEAAELRKEKKFDAAVAPAVVKSEARTYSPKAETSFIADAYAAQFNNDFAAKDRLARHMNEEKIERRDVTSANFAGLVVPQFLTELAAPFARAGRPFLDVARKHQLPDAGLTLSASARSRLVLQPQSRRKVQQFRNQHG
jgi:hypothetical protein